MSKLKYGRVLLKISGEALAGDSKFGIDTEVLGRICNSIKKAYDLGVEIGIVIGAGNIWRGRSGVGMDRTTADHMGMLATAINCLAMQDALETRNIPVRTQSAIEMRQISEPYIRKRAVRHLEKGRVVIFACGTGNPFFSTDTAAALRAAEIEATVFLKATNVDGVYDQDPSKNPEAKKYDKLTLMDVVNQELGVMDITAATMCKENNIPILVFNLSEPDNNVLAVKGEKIGTLVE